ncbi:methylated-DNA--[protein]-cysteine S-methyltransferase [Castellaniella sp.]|uniref:methylated-DNA--[protein]-cysteine S-methyltransferase n=1 Tax=Castellaniella sp. TaxID=1955812 RepID=UPI002B003707|nr:methylated-DNA--[protein]-cysteine S-methyltransferase [Castellaniella sp.]
MSFHALLSSPLGEILLTADALGLTGLYFTDQRDCPHLPGLAPASEIVSQPSAGIVRGRAARTLKAVRAGDAAAGELFPLETPGVGGVDHMQPAAMRLLQDDTPAGVLSVLEQTRRELDEYWCGERQVFDVPLDPQGTIFQKRVWQALLDVPCGATLSYGELGERAGLGAGHGRAVGTAVGSNPISIIIPCHRILARNGTLNGYGGGLGRKARLLEIEGFTICA